MAEARLVTSSTSKAKGTEVIDIFDAPIVKLQEYNSSVSTMYPYSFSVSKLLGAKKV